MKERPKIKITKKTNKTGQPSLPLKDSTGQKNTDHPAILKGRSLFLFLKQHALLSVGIFLFITCSCIVISQLMSSSDPVFDNSQNATSAVANSLTEKDEGFELPEDVNLSALTEQFKQMDDYSATMRIIEEKISLSKQLGQETLPSKIADELIYLGRSNDIRYLSAGTSWYTISCTSETDEQHLLYIYKLSPSHFYLIQALPKPAIQVFTKTEDVKTKAIAGIIKTNLWDAILERDGNHRIIEKMEDALKYVVDFYHIKPNDKFRILYEEVWVEDKVVDVGKLLAVSFETNDQKYYAIDYQQEGKKNNYVDQYGKTLKRMFLKSPVKYNRITSPYNPKRVHPVLGGIRPHLGTDYYAKQGDPIFAVADGTISIAGHKSNNGNYIKIRHDKIYETQYLHIMDNGFAPDIKPGAVVKQGQVIGYAGQTGLATGPHVCFRFWKNGKQVDPMKEDVLYADPIAPIDEEAFLDLRDSLLLGLERIPYFDLSF